MSRISCFKYFRPSPASNFTSIPGIRTLTYNDVCGMHAVVIFTICDVRLSTTVLLHLGTLAHLCTLECEVHLRDFIDVISQPRAPHDHHAQLFPCLEWFAVLTDSAEWVHHLLHTVRSTTLQKFSLICPSRPIPAPVLLAICAALSRGPCPKQFRAPSIVSGLSDDVRNDAVTVVTYEIHMLCPFLSVPSSQNLSVQGQCIMRVCMGRTPEELRKVSAGVELILPVPPPLKPAPTFSKNSKKKRAR
ncbi:hypothetical protein BD413DRAFT_591110 [Trametes elegans]|nr:hypothetical protein BD413DRAFT_591110 [Trametes elegans]